MGQQGNFVLSEKLTSDISLTNIQPFNPSIESPQVYYSPFHKTLPKYI